MKFENLEAWKIARLLEGGVYRLTQQTGLSKDYGLRDQIQRSAVSVMSNIAEGFERIGAGEKLHFYNIAHASCSETRSLLYVIEDNYPQCAAVAAELRVAAEDVGKLVSGLIASTRRRTAGRTIGLVICAVPILYFLIAR